MNSFNTFLAVVVTVLTVALVVSLGFHATDNTGDCYSDAIELAETANHTTDRLAEYTVDTLTGITLGIPHNQSELDRIANAHHTNRSTLADIQNRCDAS